MKNSINIKDIDGFTLVELILSLALYSLIIIAVYNIFALSISTGESLVKEDDIIQNGRYTIDYITREIRNGDEIISSDKFTNLNTKYPVNLGFVIKKEINDDNYRYITYYHYLDKIRRCSVDRKGESYPEGYMFEGHNTIAEDIYGIGETNVDFENKIITFDFLLKDVNGQPVNFKKDIFIRCPVDY